MSEKPRATIDLVALARNYQILKERLSPGVLLGCVVKDDAYGLGDVAVARTLAAAGATCLVVAFVDEAVRLREACLGGQILVLHPPRRTEVRLYRLHGLTGTAWSAADVACLGEDVSDEPLKMHVEIDTGMHRGGVEPEALPQVARGLTQSSGVMLEGAFSHLADANDLAFSEEQRSRFADALEVLSAYGHTAKVRHLASSAAILLGPSFHFDMVRPGLALYGAWPVPGDEAPRLRPVLSVVTELLKVKTVRRGESAGYDRAFRAERDTRIGVVAAGYAHGLTRELATGACVLIRGRRARFLGHICMDLALVDLEGIPEARAGDEVVLLGSQGEEMISIHDMASWLHVAPHEVLCKFGTPCQRRYIHDPESTE